jgi:hypothetical protein
VIATHLREGKLGSKSQHGETPVAQMKILTTLLYTRRSLYKDKDK